MCRMLPLLGEMPRGAASAAWHGERDAEGETRRGTDAAPETTSRVRPGPQSDGLERPVESCSAVGLAPRASPARPHGTLRHALRATARAQAPRDGHCTHTRPEPDTAADTGVGYPLAPGQAGRAPAPPRRAPAPYPRTADPRPRPRESVAPPGTRRRASVASRDDRTSACHTPILGQDQKCVLGVHAGNNKISSPWGEAPHSTVYGCW
jgi:hypothetical protein